MLFHQAKASLSFRLFFPECGVGLHFGRLQRESQGALTNPALCFCCVCVGDKLTFNRQWPCRGAAQRSSPPRDGFTALIATSRWQESSPGPNFSKHDVVLSEVWWRRRSCNACGCQVRCRCFKSVRFHLVVCGAAGRTVNLTAFPAAARDGWEQLVRRLHSCGVKDDLGFMNSPRTRSKASGWVEEE